MDHTPSHFTSRQLQQTELLLDKIISHVEWEQQNKARLQGIATVDATGGDCKATPMFTSPASVYPVLPIEVVDNICRRLSDKDLTALVRANSALHAIGMRKLYYSIGSDFRLSKLLKCMKTIDEDPEAEIALLVRTFEVNVTAQHLLRGFYVLLRRVLVKMRNLTTLVLELPRLHSPVWVLPMPPYLKEGEKCFSLQSLTTSMDCKRPLAEFLDTQPEIRELTLRGVQECLPLFPLLSSLFADLDASNGPQSATQLTTGNHLNHHHRQRNADDPDAFLLRPSSLPHLTQFNAIHAGPSLIRAIVSHRPLRQVSVPLFPPSALSTLSALSSSSLPLSRLSIMSFDPAAPNYLFREVSKRFKKLEALHIVLLMAEVNAEVLIDWGRYLSEFERLRYITFMAALGGGGSGDEEERQEIDEKKIANAWHAWCPTLKTIILPQGKVWFEGSRGARDDGAGDGEARWRSLDLGEF